MGIVLVEKAVVDDKLRIRSCTIEDVDLRDENIINITVCYLQQKCDKHLAARWQWAERCQQPEHGFKVEKGSFMQMRSNIAEAEANKRLEFAYFFSKSKKCY